jgi:hypothetical protein
MRLFGLGLLLVACGGTSAEFASLTDAGGAAGEGGAGSGGSAAQSRGSAGSISAAAGAGTAGAISRGGAGSAQAGNGGSASKGVPSSGGKSGAPAGGGAGAPGAGAGGMSMAGAGDGVAGAPMAGAGGAACVARKACASAGVIVDNCIPCDEQHCGSYSDGCTGMVDCGSCSGSGEFCSTVHVCKSLTADCSEYQGLKGSICLRLPLGGTTQTFWCPTAPQTNACVWSAPDSCWKCNGA